MRSIFLITIISFIAITLAQGQKLPKSFWVESGIIPASSKVLKGSANQVYYKTSEDQYWMKTIHPDTKVVTIEARYRSKAFKTLHGRYIERYDNGENWMAGNHIEGRPIGRWTFYYSNGSIEKEIAYNKESKVNGQLKEYNRAGQLLKVSTYKNDRLSGNTIILSPEADTISICAYNYGKLEGCNLAFEEIEFDKVEEPRYTNMECEAKESQAAKTACANNYLSSKITDQWVTPANIIEDDIYGTLVFSLHIDESGQLDNIEVLRGLSNNCTYAVLKQIEQLDQWSPQKVNGKSVRSEQLVQFQIGAVVDIRNTHSLKNGHIVERKVEGRISTQTMGNN